MPATMHVPSVAGSITPVHPSPRLSTVPKAGSEAMVAKDSISLDEARTKVRDARNKQVPMQRMGDAMDVAEAAVFLASDKASFITGLIMPVDGGSSVATGCLCNPP